MNSYLSSVCSIKIFYGKNRKISGKCNSEILKLFQHTYALNSYHNVVNMFCYLCLRTPTFSAVIVCEAWFLNNFVLNFKIIQHRHHFAMSTEISQCKQQMYRWTFYFFLLNVKMFLLLSFCKCNYCTQFS